MYHIYDLPYDVLCIIFEDMNMRWVINLVIAFKSMKNDVIIDMYLDYINIDISNVLRGLSIYVNV
jgi:hypothetical protein